MIYCLADASADSSILDSSAGDGLDPERQSPRRSRTPIRRNDDYIIGDKAFDDVLLDSGAFEERDIKPKIKGNVVRHLYDIPIFGFIYGKFLPC